MGDPDVPTSAPAVSMWDRVDERLWARVVPHLRRTLVDTDVGERSATHRRVAAAPPKRLQRGRARTDALTMLVDDVRLWRDLRRRVMADEALATDLAIALSGPAPAPDAGHGNDRPPADATVPAVDEERLQRLRDRLRNTREERDDARRRLQGESARADAATADAARLQSELAAAHGRIAALERDLDEAAAVRAEAVERERRRQEAERARLEAELSAFRRRDDDAGRRERARERAREAARERAAAPTRARGRGAPTRPGRPTPLPRGVAPDTTEAARALLTSGREVLIDGYNVTRTHRGDVDLESQRQWLVDRLAAAVPRIGIEPTIVFDAHQSRGRPTSTRNRDVWVAFTAEGQTADDDIVFRVEARPPDAPIVVVTDDRELRDRLRPYGVDLVRTSNFLGALG